MTKIRITDFNNVSTVVQISETADEFNARLDEAWNTRMYLMRITGFVRMDVRNIASITVIEEAPPAPAPAPAETPEEPAAEPEPEN